MSDTPRTDAVTVNTTMTMGAVVPAAFSRNLERELDAARHDLERATTNHAADLSGEAEETDYACMLAWRKEALSLRQQSSSILKDAQRYRWLRTNSTAPVEPWSTHSPESFDHMIDQKILLHSTDTEERNG